MVFIGKRGEEVEHISLNADRICRLHNHFYLTRFNLGKVKYCIDQAEQMSAVVLDPLEHRLHLFGRRAIDAVRDQLRTWAGGEHLVPQFQKSI